MKRKPKSRKGGESPAACAALARMMQAEENTPEYWDAFKEYAREEATAKGDCSRRTVNGISVNDPDFTRLVLDSMKESDPDRIKYENNSKGQDAAPAAQLTGGPADPGAAQSAQDLPARA